MSDPLDEQLGFAPDYNSPVPYMQRTRGAIIPRQSATPRPTAGRTMSMRRSSR